PGGHGLRPAGALAGRGSRGPRARQARLEAGGGVDRRVGLPGVRARNGMSGAGLLLAVLAAAGAAPRAPVGSGEILRDEETLRAVAATRGVTLPKDPGLELVVTKSRYRLDVKRGEALLKVFPVALGGRPEGPKTRTTDGRTPEGRYRLIPHHQS